MQVAISWSPCSWAAPHDVEAVLAAERPASRCSFLATPIEKRQTVRTPLGNGELRIFALPVKAGTFAVGVTEFPESALANTTDDQRLDQARDGAVQQSKGKIRWEKKVLVDYVPNALRAVDRHRRARARRRG